MAALQSNDVEKEIARVTHTRAHTRVWVRGVVDRFPGANEVALWAGVIAANGVHTDASIAVHGPPELLAMVQVEYGGQCAGDVLTVRGNDVCAMFRDAWQAAGGLFPSIPDDRAKVSATHRLWACGALLGRRCHPTAIPGASADRVEVRLQKLWAMMPRVMAGVDAAALPDGLPTGIRPVSTIDVAWELVPLWKAARDERSATRARREAEAKDAALKRLTTPGPLALAALKRMRHAH